MKKCFTLIMCICLLCGCSVTTSPLVGKYQDSSVIEYSEKSYNEVWNRVIDLLANKGIVINSIDKASGIIVSSDYELFGKYCFETAQKPEDHKAWAVLDFWGKIADKPIHPTKISCNFTIRLREAGGKTEINVRLANIVALHQKGNYSHFYNAKSTGVFEKEFANQIK